MIYVGASACPRPFSSWTKKNDCISLTFNYAFLKYQCSQMINKFGSSCLVVDAVVICVACENASITKLLLLQ